MKLLKFIYIHPYIWIWLGLYVAFMGYNECGFYHQCGQSSWPRKAEVAGLGLAAVGVLTTILRAFYKIIMVMKKRK